jgi:hypothetical protein
LIHLQLNSRQIIYQNYSNNLITNLNAGNTISLQLFGILSVVNLVGGGCIIVREAPVDPPPTKFTTDNIPNNCSEIVLPAFKLVIKLLL